MKGGTERGRWVGCKDGWMEGGVRVRGLQGGRVRGWDDVKV